MTALVLSAGGMFCAYQAGAWEAISRLAAPDLVTGASAGALNAWPIAAGCPPELLIRKWLEPRTGDALRLRPNAGWRNGWFQPEALQRQAEETFAEFCPRMPVGIVVVRLPQWRPVLVRTPDITADHLRATCSIPVLLPPVKIGGVRYVDGGLFDKLPVQQAIEMGATRIIAVDSFPGLRLWWLRAGTAVVRALRKRRRLPPDFDLTVIAPSEPLGDARDAVVWKRENMMRWIDLGRRDAVKALTICETRLPAYPSALPEIHHPR